jgi:hypothetical protein
MLNGIDVSLQTHQLTEQTTPQERVVKAVEELAAELAAGKSESLETYLKFLARFHEYSFANALLIAIQRGDATLVAGRRCWERMGRKVMVRERPIGIFAPMTRPVLVLDMESDEDLEEERLLGFRIVHVFDVSQTEGKPLPEFGRTQGDATRLIPAMERVITEANIRLAYESLPFGTNGWTDGSTVAVRQDLESADKFRCLVHELAHCLLDHVSRRRGTPKRVRETEAEAVACVVCHAFGINARKRSRDYIHLWDGSAETLMQSLSAVQHVAGSIISKLDTELSGADATEHVGTP